MKTINLYFKFHFTSLSLDAQPISMAVVSEYESDPRLLDSKEGMEYLKKYSSEYEKEEYEKITRTCKTFYAEFTDYDIDRCDDWVKENVISNIHLKGSRDQCSRYANNINCELIGAKKMISKRLISWLKQFDDCNIQFVMDCSQLGYLWMLDLLDKRASSPGVFLVPSDTVPADMTNEEFIAELKKGSGVIYERVESEISFISHNKRGLPQLPDNVSPVPQDLNDLLAFKKGIKVREAFDLSRGEMFCKGEGHASEIYYELNQYNALFDAKVIKVIYNQK